MDNFISSQLERILSQYSNEQLQQMNVEIDHYTKQFQASPSPLVGLMILLLAANKANENLPQEVRERITCKKGCAHCCHIRANATSLEAELIVDYCRTNNISIDTERLEKQKDLDQTAYMFSPHKRCVFLADDNTCKIYPVRPFVCRNHQVTSNPDLCDVDKYPSGFTGNYLNLDALLPAIALLISINETDHDSLPNQLLKAIKK